MMDPKKLVKVLNQQEDMLKFDTFTNKEAFELGDQDGTESVRCRSVPCDRNF